MSSTLYVRREPSKKNRNMGVQPCMKEGLILTVCMRAGLVSANTLFFASDIILSSNDKTSFILSSNETFLEP